MILIVAMALLAGCNESQKTFGQGNLPENYQEFFGDTNLARLNFVQSQEIASQGKVLEELIKRVRFLEEENPAELAERVKKLETRTPATIDVDESLERILGKDIHGKKCTLNHSKVDPTVSQED